MPAASPRVMAVIVSFHPDVEALHALIEQLLSQGTAVVVVDNGSEMATVERMLTGANDKVHWICLPENRGVAAAQNLGIRLARLQQMSHVLLLDQDSRPAEDMVGRLIEAWAHLQSAGRQPAVVGPRYTDERQDNPPPFISTRWGRLVRQRRRSGELTCEVDYLISSGSLIALPVLDEVGPMDEGLFIDYVDIDWGWRARSRGFQCFGAWEASMAHDLGDEPVVLWGRAIPVRSPERYYYMFRNALVVLRRAYVPWRWRIVESYRLLLRAIVWSAVGPNRKSSARAIAAGLKDGWSGQQGRNQRQHF